MPHRADRRQFLQTTAAAGIGFWIAAGTEAAESTSPNEQVAIASIGLGRKGLDDAGFAAGRGNLVAICDVDEGRLEGVGRRYPKAKKYTDYRKMFDEMGDSIDAVTVSTPDHMHAPIALMAMRLHKHCFCQTPLARTVYEARLMAKVAKEKNVATQMGNQGTANPGLRRAAAMMRSGALGTVTEVHVWTDAPTWEQGIGRPLPSNPPQNLQWDLWLGVAPVRPYAAGYHPVGWRGWWDFGTGAMGDMGCHLVNMPFMGLDLRNPASVQAETAGHNKDSFPKWSIVHFEFAANDSRGAIKLVWYDGGKQPDKELLDGDAPARDGCLVIGSKGKLYSGSGYGGIDKLYGEAAKLYGEQGEKSEAKVVQSPGHFQEWLREIRGGKPAMSNFPNYAGPLTETILLGNLAVWVAASGKGQRVDWEPVNLKATNVKGLEEIIKPTYHPGYTLDV